jgi:hypothetical protein
MLSQAFIMYISCIPCLPPLTAAASLRISPLITASLIDYVAQAQIDRGKLHAAAAAEVAK